MTWTKWLKETDSRNYRCRLLELFGWLAPAHFYIISRSMIKAFRELYSRLQINRQFCTTPMKDFHQEISSPSSPKRTKKDQDEIKTEITMPEVAEERVSLRFAKLSTNATTPTRGSPLSAGYDLYSAYDYTVKARGKEIVKTDIQIALPDGCYGRVAPRSGLAAKHFIDVGAGVIDQDYRGNVGVVLFNFSDQDFEIKKGDRVAQLVCEKIYLPHLEELPSLDETERGSGGFGSTGKN